MKNARIKFYVLSFLVIGLLPFAFKPLQFGMDFTGGTIINIRLSEPVQGPEKDALVRVLQDRLNKYGLKDMRVRPGGPDFVMVEVAETDPAAIASIQEIISEQGRFEAMFEGKTILDSDDIIGVVTDPAQGYRVYNMGNGYSWSVPFLVSSEGAEKFFNAVAGRCTLDPSDPRGEQCQEKVYMFIDRPRNAVLLMTPEEYSQEKQIPEQFDQPDSGSRSTVSLEELLQNSGVGLLVTSQVDESVKEKIANKTVIIKEGSPLEEYVQYLNQSAAKVVVKRKPENVKYFVPYAINLQSIVRLTKGVTVREIYNPLITGYAPDESSAIEQRDRIRIILESGKLPVAVQVSGVSTVSASLGRQFLYYSGVAGLAAILTVSLVVFLRYRKPKLSGAMVMVSISEAIMILGMAAWIGWQLDLPSVAGVIAAVGTGVDHLIIITDEAARGERVKAGLAARIKKAVTIIMMAAFTTMIAMFPLFTLGLGALKGFALTTILGSLMGVFIARPAYAEMVGRLI